MALFSLLGASLNFLRLSVVKHLAFISPSLTRRVVILRPSRRRVQVNFGDRLGIDFDLGKLFGAGDDRREATVELAQKFLQVEPQVMRPKRFQVILDAVVQLLGPRMLPLPK